MSDPPARTPPKTLKEANERALETELKLKRHRDRYAPKDQEPVPAPAEQQPRREQESFPELSLMDLDRIERDLFTRDKWGQQEMRSVLRLARAQLAKRIFEAK